MLVYGNPGKFTMDGIIVHFAYFMFLSIVWVTSMRLVRTDQQRASNCALKGGWILGARNNSPHNPLHKVRLGTLGAATPHLKINWKFAIYDCLPLHCRNKQPSAHSGPHWMPGHWPNSVLSRWWRCRCRQGCPGGHPKWTLHSVQSDSRMGCEAINQLVCVYLPLVVCHRGTSQGRGVPRFGIRLLQKWPIQNCMCIKD